MQGTPGERCGEPSCWTRKASGVKNRKLDSSLRWDDGRVISINRQALLTGVPRPIPAELTRVALLERLERLEARLIVLAAPTGYGKTTLLAQYARMSAQPCAWVSLSAGESDPKNLLLATALALNAIGIDAPRSVAAAAHAAGGEALARALAADLSQYADALDLIFDGFERIGAVSSRWLTLVADLLVSGQRVLLSGFDLTELRLARSLARGTAVVIGVETLRFSGDEAADYLRSRGFHGDVADAVGRCDGWPVSLGLIGAGADAHLAPDDLVLDALEQLPPALRDALAELCVFELWIETQSKELLLDLPTDWLATVRRAGLPLTPLGKGVFKPHAILRCCLERELRRHPVRWVAAHRAAAQRAMRRGATLEAVEHHRHAGDLGDAFALLRAVCERLTTSAEYELIRQLLETWTIETLPDDLSAALAAAWIEVGEVARGTVVLEALRSAGRATPLAHYVLGKEAARRGDYSAELRSAEAGLESPVRDAGWRACERLKGWALVDLGRTDEAKRYASDLVSQAERHGEVHDLGAALLLAHNAHHALGEFSTCERLLRRALEVYAALDAPPRVAMLRNELADLLCSSGDLDGAQQQLEAAFSEVSALPGEVAAHLFETQGDLWSRRAQPIIALESYNAAARLCVRHRLAVLGERISGKCAALERPSLPLSANRLVNMNSPLLELHITSFGERSVRVGAQPVTVSLTKSFELLVYLALRGPSTREAIIDALWDGSREARHQEYFKVAVRRLRAQLSVPETVDFNPVPLGERYALSPRFQIRLDADVLEQPDGPDALERALRGLQGSFMEGVDSEWVSLQRDHFAVLREAAWLHWGLSMRSSAPERALGVLERGVKDHPISEELLLNLIELHCELGQPLAAVMAFARFKNTLRAEFGLKPDTQLLERLTRIGFPALVDSLVVPRTRGYFDA